MISKTDSILFVYSTGYIRVKVYLAATVSLGVRVCAVVTQPIHHRRQRIGLRAMEGQLPTNTQRAQEITSIASTRKGSNARYSLMLATASYGLSYVQTAYSDFVPPMGIL